MYPARGPIDRRPPPIDRLVGAQFFCQWASLAHVLDKSALYRSLSLDQNLHHHHSSNGPVRLTVAIEGQDTLLGPTMEAGRVGHRRGKGGLAIVGRNAFGMADIVIEVIEHKHRANIAPKREAERSS